MIYLCKPSLGGALHLFYKKLHLSNYKCFDDITFSLTSKNNKAKNLAIVYGANGSGKSTLLEAFATLHDLTKTKDISNALNALRDKINLSKNLDIDDMQDFSKYLYRGTTSVPDIYDNIIGIKDNKPTIIKLDFEENGSNGSYEIRLQDGKITFEELKYKISKNKGCYFKLDKDKTYINESIINDKKTLKSIKDLIAQSWGIHSFISIAKCALLDYTEEFIESTFLEGFIHILNSFDNFSYRICYMNKTVEGISKNNSYILSHITEGYIKKATKSELKNIEKPLSQLLRYYIEDLVKIKYDMTDEMYRLYLVKTINGQEKKIEYSKESSGIKELINILPYIIMAMKGEIVVLDEYANHIHDLLSANYLESIIPLINGQLIISTHSTILLSQLNKKNIDSFYFIKNSNSIRDIICIIDIEPRIRNDYNYQNKYLFNEMYADFRFNEKINTLPIDDSINALL